MFMRIVVKILKKVAKKLNIIKIDFHFGKKMFNKNLIFNTSNK